MTDWYSFFTGRPDPGRRAPTPASRYLDDPERTPSREDEPHLRRQEVAPGSPVVPAVRQPPSHVYSQPGSDTPMAPTPLSAMTGVARYPLPPARMDPYGEDFATWYNDTSNNDVPGRIPDFGEEEDPAGRAPRNPENVIDDATSRLSDEYVATRDQPRAEAHYRSRGNIRTSQPQFDPVQEAPPEAFVPVTPRPEFNPTQEWIAAEERANERWRRGEPSTADLVFAAVFGNRARRPRIETELEQMRDEVRNNGAERDTEGGGGW